MTTASRQLIVNADDFGQSPGVNAGIVKAFESGVLTSTSLMVRWPAAVQAAAYAASHPALSVGLHVDLGEWFHTGEGWEARYRVVPIDEATAVEREVEHQLERFRDLVGRDPTHLDSHQHAHRHEPARSVLIAIARRIGVPLRHFTQNVRYCGAFYGQTARGVPLEDTITVAAFGRILSTLAEGVTELACHPAAADEVGGAYRRERIEELRTLCDARVRNMLVAQNIELTSFHAVKELEWVA